MSNLESNAEIEGALKNLWWAPVLRGVFAVLFGLLALFWPGITVLALVILFGAYAIVDGVMAIIGAFTRHGPETTTGSRVLMGLMGILGIAAGVIAFVWPGITAVALAWVIAFWAVFTGILEISAAFASKSATGTFGWLALVSGALSIVLGLLIMFQPGRGAVALVWAIGALAIVWGVVLIASGFSLRSITKDVTDSTGTPGKPGSTGDEGTGLTGGTAHPA